MSADIKITLDVQFSKDLASLADFFRSWDKSLLDNLVRVLKTIGVRWKGEAQKRVPVDEGTLKQRILYEVFKEAGNWICAVGTNVPYGKFLEFGTKWIAGGRVQALGEGSDITDAQAIKNWPAKNAGFVDEKTGVANQAAVSASLRAHQRGSPQEEMPWLRSSLSAIKAWAIQAIIEAAQPPDKKVA
jgi:hypothetical protein